MHYHYLSSDCVRVGLSVLHQLRYRLSLKCVAWVVRRDRLIVLLLVQLAAAKE